MFDFRFDGRFNHMFVEMFKDGTKKVYHQPPSTKPNTLFGALSVKRRTTHVHVIVKLPNNDPRRPSRRTHSSIATSFLRSCSNRAPKFDKANPISISTTLNDVASLTLYYTHAYAYFQTIKNKTG